MQAYEPGEVIARQEVVGGRVWLEQPVTVVADDGRTLAVRVDPGSPMRFPPHPLGEHPWSARSAWEGPTVLQLVRDGDPYAVWAFYGPDGTFRHWYVNFEAPLVRGERHVQTHDHGLDIVLHPDGSWVWKDVVDLHHLRTSGRLDTGEVLDVLEAAAGVEADLVAGRRWWSRWDDWRP